MARPIRKANADARPRSDARLIPLSEVKDDFSRYLKEAASGEIVITRHGRPAGVLIGFESEEDWLEYQLETDPRFFERIARARAELREGRGIRLEDADL